MIAGETSRKEGPVSVEKRSFKLHPHVFYSLVNMQAGTLQKAVLEGVMNAADAKARRCDLTVDEATVVIADDGQGFRSRQEIDEWFEIFGQPHEEAEKKVYGSFRIGRGQMFKFGVNDWTSGTFRMHVDAKNRGNDYDLTTDATPAKGCKVQIALYERLLPSALLEVRREVARMVKYMEISGLKVFLNGERASMDPAGQKWDAETDDAYIKLTQSGSLSIYNQGALVTDMNGRTLGTGGTVVSKLRLKVNFARNDVMSECPVWRRVRKAVDQRATQRNRTRQVHSDWERDRLAQQMLAGELSDEDAANLRLFTDVCGRNWSARQIDRALYSYDCKVSVAAKGDRRGDVLHQQKVAFILAQETLDRFEARDTKTLLHVVADNSHGHFYHRDIKHVPFSTLGKGLRDNAMILPDSKTSPSERVWVRLLQGGQGRIVSTYHGGLDRETRKICVGESDSYEAWTDGQTYIAFSRRLLRGLKFDLLGVLRAYKVLLHECVHDGPDSAEHVHGAEFYQEFHDHVDVADETAVREFACLPRLLAAEGMKVKMQHAKDLDKLERASRESKGFELAAAMPVKPVDRKPAGPAKAECPYSGKSKAIFEAFSDFVEFDSVIGDLAGEFEDKVSEEDAKAKGKTRRQVAFDRLVHLYRVLANPRHADNHGSREERQGGKVRLVVCERGER